MAGTSVGPSRPDRAQRLLHAPERGRAPARAEREVVAAYDTTIVCSDEDAAALAATPLVVPNGVDLDRFVPTPLPGAAGGRVPRRAVHRSQRRRRALVRGGGVAARARPPPVDARLAVVGMAPVPEVVGACRTRPGVTLAPPTCRRPSPYLAAARVAVVPLRVGTGSRLKALEAMAAGRPVVGTTIGLGGLDVAVRRDALVADDAGSFAGAVVEVLDDDGSAGTLAASGPGTGRGATTAGSRSGGTTQTSWLGGCRLAPTAPHAGTAPMTSNRTDAMTQLDRRHRHHPVRNRRDLLAVTLDALDEPDARGDFEVIVIDDGSTDGAGDSPRRARSAARPCGCWRTGRGAVAARRPESRRSSPVLAFTDSDCEPDPHWFETGMKAIEAGADWCTAGRSPHAGCGRWSGRSARRTTGCSRPATPSTGARRSTPPAASTSPPRTPRLPPRRNVRGMGFGEDTLLGWRLVRSGAEVVYEPEALVVHHVFPADFRDQLSRAWSLGAFPTLVRDVPELQAARSSTTASCSAAATDVRCTPPRPPLAARRPLAIVAAGGWWAYTRGRGGPTGADVLQAIASPSSSPRRCSSTPSTATSLVVGSVRARTLPVC